MDPNSGMNMDQIYLQVKQAIESGKLLIGERLRVDKIAQELQVSEPQVQEALSKLTPEGLVRKIPHLNIWIASLSHKKLDDVLSIMEVLESFAAKMAAQNIDEQGLQVLRDKMTLMQECSERADAQAFAQTDKEFHATIVKYSNNRELIDILDNLLKIQNAAIGKPHAALESFKTTIIEHHLITDYLANRDGDLAEKMLYIHSGKYYDNLKKYYQVQLSNA